MITKANTNAITANVFVKTTEKLKKKNDNSTAFLVCPSVRF